MSAKILIVRTDTVLLATDGASYTADGILRSIVQKAYPLPTLHMVVSGMGAGGAALIFASEFTDYFRCFDEAVDKLEAVMPLLVAKHFDDEIAGAPFTDFTLDFIGYSQARRRPEAYSMFFCEPEDEEHWREKAKQSNCASLIPFKLEAIAGLTANPPVSAETMRAAGMVLEGSEAEILGRFTDVDLFQVMELQRQRKAPLRPGLESHHWIGGLCLITRVDAAGISQRVIHRWPDKIGKTIKPEPIDWRKWNAANHRAGTVPLMAPMSRLQLEIAERKARKQARRAG